MAIEKLPGGKYRAVVRHDGHKAASAAVATLAGAAMEEAHLKMQMSAAVARTANIDSIPTRTFC